MPKEYKDNLIRLIKTLGLTSESLKKQSIAALKDRKLGSLKDREEQKKVVGLLALLFTICPNDRANIESVYQFFVENNLDKPGIEDEITSPKKTSK